MIKIEYKWFVDDWEEKNNWKKVKMSANEMREFSELEPCKFCGSNPEIVDFSGQYLIQCSRKGCDGRVIGIAICKETTIKSAVKWWNEHHKK